MVKKSYTFFIIIIIAILGIAYNIFMHTRPDIKEIKLGASLPLNGINKNLGKEVVIGANAYFSHINARGGINGKKIKFIYYDDKYEPEITLNNTKQLMTKDKVFALFDFVGTPTVKMIMPIIKKSQIPFIAPYTGAQFLRNPKIKNIVNLRSSYAQEIDALVGYLVKTKKFTKFSIFYQDDDYGKEGYIALLKALKKRKLHLISEGVYKRNTLFIRQAIYDIKSATPQAIILVGAYKPTARFIKIARKSGLDNVTFCPISFVNADALVNELKGDSHKILFSQTVPSYDKKTKSTQEYRKFLKFYYPKHKPTLASFESFLAAKAVVTALRNTGINLNAQNFLYQIKHLKQGTLDEIKINYKNSQLLNEVYLSRYINGKFVIVSRKK